MNELDKIEINDVDGMEKLKKNKQNTQCEIFFFVHFLLWSLLN